MSNFTVKILQDTDTESPREWDNAGTMACWHRNYTLGDVQPKQTPGEYIREQCPEGSVVLNLYLYDHSGITISTGEFACSFDSGWVGFIFATPETIAKEWSGDKEAARKCLEAEVKVYDQFLTGDVWGFVAEETEDCCECGSAKVVDEDSCWGFYGMDLESMKEHLDPKYHEALEAAAPY